MEHSIDKIFELLSWNNDDDIQLYGIQEAKKIANLSVLIMPLEDKTIWENCAKVFRDKSDQELRPYICKLFEWLQDLNWPGANIIYERLTLVKDYDITFFYQFSLSCAASLNDIPWELALKDFYVDYVKKKTGDGTVSFPNNHPKN